VLLGLTLVVLVVSGAWLWFNYRPEAAQQWADITGTPAGTSTWLRDVHRYTADASFVLALLTLVLLLASRVGAGRRGVVAGVGVLLTALAASITGDLLPWDQVALWAVTVGSNTMKGMRPAFDSRVKYVLIDGHEVSLSTYRFWAITHVVLGVLVAVAALLAWLRTREPAPETKGPELVDAR
jgi:quinol-cytochrome oxidoreductase complex cytochrome b subunit